MVETTFPFRFDIDGSALGNPGPAGIGGLLYTLPDEEILYTFSIPIGHATNNIAEYRAILFALHIALSHGIRRLLIRSDSTLIVNHLNGAYRVRSEQLFPLFEEAFRRLGRLEAWSLIHVPRKVLSRADKLAKQASEISQRILLKKN